MREGKGIWQASREGSWGMLYETRLGAGGEVSSVLSSLKCGGVLGKGQTLVSFQRQPLAEGIRTRAKL